MIRSEKRRLGCRPFLWGLLLLAAAESSASFTIRKEAAMGGGSLRAGQGRLQKPCSSSPRTKRSDSYLALAGGSHPVDGGQGDVPSKREKLVGRSLLLLVAFLYGTLYVCLRRVYALSNPPTAAALSATRGWLAALCFLHLPFQSGRRNRPSSTHPGHREPSRRLLWWTAGDLAFWNFMAQGLTNVGLLHCPSARASFLIQSSVIFTPLLSLGVGQTVSRPLWIGVGLAFAGLSVLSWGGGEIASSSATVAVSTVSGGDGIVLGGALCWSIYLLRLSRASSAANNRHQMEFPAVPLQAIKTLLLAGMYTCWWLLDSILLHKGSAAVGTTPWWNSGVAWFWLALSAIGPGAVADVLQQKGAQHLSATEANIIMSSEPVFTAATGLLLLGEQLSTREVVGGAIILSAAFVSSVS